MKIGLLITGHVPQQLRTVYGDYDRIFRRFLDGNDFEFRDFFVVDNHLPAGPEVADAWLITGSRHGVYEDHPWIPPLERLIRQIRDSGKPLVGICFGHQIIAQALGGTVEKYPGGWAVGRTTYDSGSDALTLNAWHQDQVIAPPPGAEVIASNDFCPFAGLRYGDTVLTYQAHPEFTTDYARDLAEIRGPTVLDDETLQRSLASLEGPNDNDAIAAKIAAFLSGAKVTA
ncbi:type 1 glutamine amidotransferase [Aliishimia ponticola]|uniref:Type 1 glutamine amidotransferase n=1 Tax=Aliishimia ponticola TaxID=2499833 RepID=A0A4S4N952_9RHOB|nr:type 1 glutamine amidotransferase [Aliishimia ponticola]THH35756.1 type 1 glutamine amidotransferase [Aliishimia ponticola]